MVFRFDFTSFSSLRGILLVGLYASAILEPDYVYQPNYLNGSAYCSLQITYTYFFFIPIPNFQWVCTNACALGPLGKMPIFDYIVVGSGPAGSAIAYRLAQANSARTVLLIEAGDEPEIEAIAPHLFPFNLNASTTNNHYAEPMANYSLAFKNGTNCNWGRAIGGSTQINAMMYVCGTDDNYNKWAIAANDSSWNYTNILQYIKKHQNVQDLNLNTGACANYHSTSGPIVVTNTGYTNDDFFPIYRTAVTQANYSILNDINCGPPYNGFVNLGMTIKAGERMTAGRGFLVSPIKTYSNFFFLRNGTVSKVLATKDATTGTILVTGVNVVTNISTCTNIVIKASREIILSAGSYGSPQILQRSGIGKAADLAACGINQLKELPVGSNLNDHPVGISFFKFPSINLSLRDPFGATAFFIEQALNYVNATRYGYFSDMGISSFNGFINVTSNTAPYPDIQYVAAKFEQNQIDFNITMNDKFGYIPSFANQLIALNKNYALVQVFTTVLNPKSRGSVRYRSCTDIYAPPIINGNYLNDPTDLATMLNGMKALCKIFNTTVMQSINVTPVIFNITECNGWTYCSDAFNQCYLKYFTINLWHPTSTCKMGASAADSVVDSNLRVFGVKRGLSTTRTNPMLRVADASIMPFVTSGNTQCPTYTIAAYQAQLSTWTTTYSNILNSKNGSVAPYPDIQIITIVYDQFQADFDIILNERYGYKSFIADLLLNATNYYQIVQIMTTLLQPKSRGTIKLNSCTDPYASPIINGNYFSDANNTDLNILIKEVKAVCDLYKTPTMTNKGAQPFIPIDECAILPYCTAYLTCYLKYISMNLYHPTGTCKMEQSAADSVIDSKLQVAKAAAIILADNS